MSYRRVHSTWGCALCSLAGKSCGIIRSALSSAIIVAAVLCTTSEDGRLCAAAFVQNRRSYTGCTDAPNPSGESGRPWCYVEPQVRHGVCAGPPHSCMFCLMFFAQAARQQSGQSLLGLLRSTGGL